MRTKHHLVFVLVLVGMLAASAPSRADSYVNVTLDENGHGNMEGFAFSGIVGLDPGPNGGAALIYPSPVGVPFEVGDVLLVEPGGSPTELLRFTANQTSQVIALYSNPDSSVDLADTGWFPSQFQPNLLTLPVTALGGGATGCIYTPTPGQPGYVSLSPRPMRYNVIADVPEPSTALLLAVAGIGLAGFFWRKRKISG